MPILTCDYDVHHRTLVTHSSCYDLRLEGATPSKEPNPMRRLSFAIAFVTSILLISCTRSVPPTAAPPQPAVTAIYSIPPEQEAVILRLEDRREFDEALAWTWAGSKNILERERIALALARIGTATFHDANGNGAREEGETAAGIEVLATLASDPVVEVRRAAAFALGEIGDPAGIEPLLRLADDAEHADIAAEAVEALAKMAASVPLDRYAAFTKAAAFEGQRARAIRYLFRFGSDEASAIAAAALGDAAPGIRAGAAYALSRRAYPPAREKLDLLLTDSDALTRAYAARALGLIAAAESHALIVGALLDPHPWVRTNAARALTQIATTNPSVLIRASAPTDALRLVALTQDPDPGARAVAIEPLAMYAVTNEAARARLLEILSNGSRWQRELAAGSVAKYLGPDADKVIAPLLGSADPGFKRALLDATGTIESGKALRRQLSTDADPTVRAAAIGAIPDGEVNGELALVQRALDDPDAVVRANAIDRLALQSVLARSTALGMFFKARQTSANDAWNDARIAAIRGIAQIDFPGRKTLLLEALGDKDPVLRRIAAEAIRERLGEDQPQYTPLPIDRPMAEYVEIATWAAKRHSATITMPRGTIQLVLLSRDAPMTAWNFAQLASKGYFNDSSFMRVVPNFVIQGGDPRNDMTGGPGYAIRDEINLQKYTRGAVGMALSGLDTGGSQFFIAHSPQPHLDGGYTIFARVVGGMSGVVDQTERGDAVTSIAIDSTPAPEMTPQWP